MSSAPLERQVLENALAELRAEGFDVYVHPSKEMLPPFLRTPAPDAIALRGDEKIAIEVVGGPGHDKVEKIRLALPKDSGWKLRVIGITPQASQPSLERVSEETIRQTIKSVEQLRDGKWFGPALLMAWATFEALGRSLMETKFSKPQTPGRLIEVLANGGQLTPNESDRLRKLASIRNTLVHGGLNAKVGVSDVDDFIEILESLAGMLPSRHRMDA
jgi:uncharacterized protein YutE (UPF0331/DUF86 family)